MKKILISTTLIAFGCFPAYGCESGYSIESVLSDGKIIKLDDGTVWEVINGDESTSSTWTAASEVVVCDDDKIINTDDNESVDVSKIK